MILRSLIRFIDMPRLKQFNAQDLNAMDVRIQIGLSKLENNDIFDDITNSHLKAHCPHPCQVRHKSALSLLLLERLRSCPADRA